MAQKYKDIDECLRANKPIGAEEIKKKDRSGEDIMANGACSHLQ
jgi:hypothetical protein